MQTIYTVSHVYDVDGGFGDAVRKVKLLFTTTNKEVAEEFIAKYSNKHVYDIPYSKLYEGEFIMAEDSLISSFNEIPDRIIELGEEMKNAKDYQDEDENYSYEEEY